MKRIAFSMLVCVLALLSFSMMVSAKIDYWLPIAKPKFENVYFKQITTVYLDETYATTTEIYSVDNIYVLQTGSDGEDSIIPFQQFQLEYNLKEEVQFRRTSDNLSLLLSNYEFRIVDFQQVAERDCIVIELYHKRDNRLVNTLYVDLESGLILKFYQYDDEGNIIYVRETIVVDYDPDISKLDLASIPEFPLGSTITRITTEEFSSLVPWANISSLPLPEGFQIISIHQMDIFEQLLAVLDNEDVMETEPIFVIALASDGVVSYPIVIMENLFDEAALIPDKILFILETDAFSFGFVMSERLAMIVTRGELTTREQRAEIIQEIARIDLVFIFDESSIGISETEIQLFNYMFDLFDLLLLF